MKIVRTKQLNLNDYSDYIIVDIQQEISADGIYYLVYLKLKGMNIFKYPQVINL